MVTSYITIYFYELIWNYKNYFYKNLLSQKNQTFYKNLEPYGIHKILWSKLMFFLIAQNHEIFITKISLQWFKEKLDNTNDILEDHEGRNFGDA